MSCAAVSSPLSTPLDTCAGGVAPPAEETCPSHQQEVDAVDAEGNDSEGAAPACTVAVKHRYLVTCPSAQDQRQQEEEEDATCAEGDDNEAAAPNTVVKHRYLVINKPADVVTQFIRTPGLNVTFLSDIKYDFPEGVNAVGRLDSESEGVLLLTTNKKVHCLLFQGEVPHTRTYIVFVKHAVSAETLHQLRTGVRILAKGNYYWTTSPCEVDIIERPDWMYDRVDERPAYGPHTWLRITLTEGKFHQVRKMVNSLGHPCKRLIRTSVEDVALEGLGSGEVREIPEEEFFDRLKIANWR